ncbi:MAG: PASTA domain-containing protein, partial [Jatrophihabitans sp.]
MAAASQGPHRWVTIARLLASLVAVAVLAAGLALPYVGGIGLFAGHEASKFLDTSCNLTETAPPQKTTLYARDGKTVIATLFSQDRVPIPLSDVPRYLQQALIATEDRRFYQHHGVDMRGLLRSAVSTSSGDTQGGSTLTMQYVKQIRYYQASEIQDPAKQAAAQRAAIAQNLDRKIEDAKCAIYIEQVKHESKAEILDNYLNIAFFGENSYGIETASQTYFGKHTKDLTLPEAALLVGLLRAPTAFDPFVNPDAARQRRNEVLQNLVTVGDLSQADADRYEKAPIQLATQKPPVVKEGCANATSTIANAAFFCEYAQTWLEGPGGISPTQLQTGGLHIVTTLDVNTQNTAQAGISAAIPATSPMTAVLPVIDPKTGDVLAMATSKAFGTNTSAQDNTHTTLPVFTLYSALGASTYKLFPLLAALSTGVPSNWPLQTPPKKQPYKASNCLTPTSTTNGDANETYNANETLASATAKSSNTFFVGLADQLFSCDLQPIVSMATKLGMNGFNQPSDTPHKSWAQTLVDQQRAQQLVLGDIPTSPLELAGAYAAIADDGRYNAPAPILSITDPDGRTIPVARHPGVQVVSPWVARQAVQILTGDTKAPGTSADPFRAWYRDNSSIVAGKTGTAPGVVGSNDSLNGALWFVGMTPNLVATSALINFDSTSAPAAGLPGVADPGTQAYGSYASGIWLDALQPVLRHQRWTWPSPSSTPGTTVPNVTGLSMADAQAKLTAAGFKLSELDATDHLLCASKVPTGNIAFYGPA